MSHKELRDKGLSDEEIKCIFGHASATEHAIKNFNWNRIAGNNAHVLQITPEVLRKLANSWFEIYNEDYSILDQKTFNIEVGFGRNGVIYRDVPWTVIESDDPSKLLTYRSFN